ncbi:hypothetical protein DBV05_g1690 [Lasiodiplodia theobromae]|uniref:Transcription activator AMTR1 n=1 Tax=Lasiodiplodia theobromae TaxID=45133 RepID=A0A5N5DNZ4_9PEZI|nr:hypothetical protein DBV05_g1690 [Lasiodiplodia theobromae]
MPELEPKRRRSSPPANTKRRRLDDAAKVHGEVWLPPHNHEAAGSDHRRLQSPAAVPGGDDDGTRHPFSPSSRLDQHASPSAYNINHDDNHHHSTAFTQAPTSTMVSEVSVSAAVAAANSASSVSGFSPELLMDPLLASSPGSGGGHAQWQGSAGFLPPSPDDYNCNPMFLASQEELRSLLFNTAQSTHPTRASSPAAGGGGGRYADEIIDAGGGGGGGGGGVGGSLSLASDRNQMKQILSTRKRVEYLKNYLAKVAPWLDMFDTSRHFGITVPALAQTQPPLLYAILALSARQMERLNSGSGSGRRGGGGVSGGSKHYPASESLELYQEAIRLLTPKLPERSPHILTCCVILCCLEMMSASPQDWRRHLEGCATLFDSFDVNGFSGGLMQAVFWCYSRMDLCGALISDGTESTLLALRKWVPANVAEDDVHDLFASHRSPDMHANYAVYLCSKACELLSDRTKYAELGVDNGCTGPAYALRWKRLWHELSLWLDERPAELLPAKTIRQKSDKPFPEILFIHWAAISSNQLYHTACILLLNSMPKSLKLDPLPVHNPLWHARRPLWIAGRMLGHHSEHAAVIELIRNIEAQTGWGMYWRIRDLEEAWGYRVR